MGLFGNMKLKDVSEWEKKDAVVDQEGTVLCPICKKSPAIVTKYGMIRNCDKCIRVKESFSAIINEFGINKHY